jgi:hypothetical protein
VFVSIQSAQLAPVRHQHLVPHGAELPTDPSRVRARLKNHPAARPRW